MTMTQESQSRKKEFYLSLRLKLLIGFTLLFMLVFAAAFYWFYTFSASQALARIQNDLADALAGGARGVDGDLLVDLAANGQPNAAGFSDDPRYQQLLDWLDTIHQTQPRAWPYLYVRGPQEREILYIVDLFAKYDPSRSTKFKESLISKGFSLGGFKALTFRTVDGRFDTYTDKWGSWVSAYAPVKDSKGNVVGAMGVDFQADYVEQVRRSILDRMLLVFLITYATLFVLVFLVSMSLTRPITVLTNAAEKIGEGNYDIDLAKMQVGWVKDEVSTLAEVIEIMVEKVSQREQTLLRQVEVLKIEIDETKRHKDVNEIVESDFFKNLQSKAQQMRNRRNTLTLGSPGDPTQGQDSA
jgi:HAMP domain-containing protein